MAALTRRDLAEARKAASSGDRFTMLGGVFIPGLYGLRAGGHWIAWDADPVVRLARVEAFFGVA